MNSMVKVFGYTNSKGESSVKSVFVMNQTEDHLQGFDLSKLTKGERKALKAALANHEVLDRFATRKNGSAEPLEGLNKVWMRAWRSYKTSEMTAVIGTEVPATKTQIVEYIASQGLGKNARAIRHNVNAVLRGKGRKTAYGYKINAVEGGYRVSR